MKKTCLRFLTGRLLLFWAIMAIGMVCACTDENPAGEEGNEGNGSRRFGSRCLFTFIGIPFYA